MDGGDSGGSGGAGAANNGGSVEEEKKKPPEGEPKAKRKMKTPSQLEILEKTYAVDNYPSESVRAELSVKLGLSDRQLQMWFCHRRLKDRKPPPAKRQKKDASPAAAAGSSAGVAPEIGMSCEVGKDHSLASLPGSSPFRHPDMQQRVAGRSGTAIARIGTDMPAMKRYYEPPQAISELRAIAFVEAQLGEPIREDGPILGMEFDPLPPGAFGAPIETASQQKPTGRSFEARLYEHPDSKPVKGIGRTLHEYQFLPEQPSIRNETYERAVSSHYYGSSSDVSNIRAPLSTGQSFVSAIEQVSPAFGLQGQGPSLTLLPQQGRLGHPLAPALGEYDAIQRKFVDTGTNAHPITGVDNPFLPSDRRVTHEEDIARVERKRKSEEARIAKEVEAHERRIRKELEKQDILKRKREEQMRKEMERQERERRKEEERLLREKQREEERYIREQRREMERREKFLQKESIRAEKLRLKEEMRREKEAARLKAANDRAVARRIAKESMELIDDERLELMELAASSKGLPSMLALDSDTLQNLDLFRDKQAAFPPKSVRLKRPFAIQPWSKSDQCIGNLLMVWRFLITFADVLGLWPFTLDELVQAFHDYDSRLLGEIHVALLRSIIKDIEDVARTPMGVGANQNSGANPGGGHPQIVEGAYAWGFDICSWQHHLNPLTWPEILRQFALSAGFGPKLKKRCADQGYARDESEGNDGEIIISNLRNGAAAEHAVAVMHERGFSNPRRSRHRLTPGTVKFAAFHVLSLEGSKGLTILEVADKIQRSGLRDLTTSKTPEASIAAALSRDTKLFERTAPSTYCVRTPYRKDPIDSEAILSAAREKIQVYKNGYFEGEDADDVERDDVDRDEDSDSDVPEDPEVDDLGTDLKPNKEVLPCEGNAKVKICLINGNDASHAKSMTSSQIDFSHTAVKLTELKSEGLVDVKSSCIPSTDIDLIQSEANNPDQEDAVIDESRPTEPWVLGLTEGEYSDLSVEERLNALVTLVTVANEGNTIRFVLEERLEAANALKKQIWAEAQVDKRRMKEEFVMKIQFPSYICNKVEQNISSAMESRQSPLPALFNKNDLASINPLPEEEQVDNQKTDLNYPNYIPSEKHPTVQELPTAAAAVPDNIQFQHSGYAAEKTRSQLKAFIGHKAEDMYVYRSLPLGQDRRRNRYWQFMTSSSYNDRGCGRIFVELRDGFWRLIDSEEGFDALLASLDVRGIRESHLHSMLQVIEGPFKETVKRYRHSADVTGQTKDEFKAEVVGSATNSEGANGEDPCGIHCVSNLDMPEPSSSFSVGIGRDEMEKRDALMRYQDFEKWMWEEGYNSFILRAMKFGKKRCKQLLGLCDYCHNVYLFEENHRSSFGIYGSPLGFNLSEHISQCKVKFGRDHGWTLHCLNSSPLLGIRLLKAQLVVIEASIPLEAFEDSWLNYRRSWGAKLCAASSADELLQILTLLEDSVLREFLSTNFETTSELVVSNNLHPDLTVNDSVSTETIPVLSWIPQTTSAVALRLMEFDASIFYTPDQKLESQNEGVGNFTMLSSKYAPVKNNPENETSVSQCEAGNPLMGSWTDQGSGFTSSIRGRGRRGGSRCRIRGGRSQNKAISSRSEAGLRSSATNIVGFGQLPGWKGQPRGRRGGRKRSRRSARSKQKQVKKVTEIVGPGHGLDVKDVMFEQTPGVSGRSDWNGEGMMSVPVDGAENATSSEYEEINGQASGYEDDDFLGDDYVRGKPEHLQPHVDYGIDGEDEEVYEDENEDDEEDDMGENVEEDEPGGVDMEGYIIADSDDENRVAIGDQIQNLDEASGSSSSSSDYSD